MSIATSEPRMTREAFFDWAQAQDMPFEFDGFRPVAMTGGTRDHSRICQNIYFALRTRLQGGVCEPLGPDAGIATIGEAVRYPDAIVTCTQGAGTDRLVPGAVVIFEVLSPTSGRTDRIIKLREYAAVSSVLRYVILESTSVGITVLDRAVGTDPWTASALTGEDTLNMPEIGTSVPVTEFYQGTSVFNADHEQPA